jgi:hypothetical protein
MGESLAVTRRRYEANSILRYMYAKERSVPGGQSREMFPSSTRLSCRQSPISSRKWCSTHLRSCATTRYARGLGKFSIREELFAAVGDLGLRVDYLDDEARIMLDERVDVGFASDHHVRVIEDIRGDPELDGFRVFPAVGIVGGVRELSKDVSDDTVVPFRRPCNREDAAADVFVSYRSRLFEREVLHPSTVR